jgi:hypothetical protein
LQKLHHYTAVEAKRRKHSPSTLETQSEKLNWENLYPAQCGASCPRRTPVLGVRAMVGRPVNEGCEGASSSSQSAGDGGGRRGGATKPPTLRPAVVEAAEQAPARHEATDTAAGRGGGGGASSNS